MKDNIKNRISYILLEEEENANTLAFIVIKPYQFVFIRSGNLVPVDVEPVVLAVINAVGRSFKPCNAFYARHRVIVIRENRVYLNVKYNA